MREHDGDGRDAWIGLLALQNRLVDAGTLSAAMAEWRADPDRPLARILLERGELSDESLARLLEIAEAHERTAGGGASAAYDLTVTRVGGGPTTQGATARYGVGTGLHDPNRPSQGSASSRFQVREFRASGGLGEVLVALDTELNREVALKRIRDRHADDPGSRARFVLEAEVTGNLEHPGVVPVYSLGSDADGRPFYAMRLIRGESLKDAIRAFHESPRGSERPSELRRLLRRFLDLCNTVAYAHSRGVIHRDLKPSNVMLGPYGETLVVDWGLAKATGRPDPIAPGGSGEAAFRPASGGDGVTVGGSTLGTPGFMSPEQAAGDSKPVGPASDVYSLGATLYNLLTGQAPFEGEDVATVLERVRRGQILSPRSVRSDVPRPLEAICLKAMAARPERRYGSARALAEDVERWLADEPIEARPDNPAEALARWSRRHRAWARAGAAALLLVSLVSIAAAVAVDQARRTEADARLDAERQAEIARRKEQDYQAARGALDRFLGRISQGSIFSLAGPGELRRRVLEEAREFYREFAERRDDDADARRDLMLTLRRIVESEAGANPRDALASARESVELGERLLAEHPDSDRDRLALAWAYHGLANVQLAGGLADEAEASYLLSAQLVSPLLDASPDDTELITLQDSNENDLAIILLNRGRLGEAARRFERLSARSLALLDRDPEAADRHFYAAAGLANLAEVRQRMGQLDEAREHYRRSWQVAAEGAGRGDTGRVAARLVSVEGGSALAAGVILIQQGRPRDALPLIDAAVEAMGRWRRLDRSPASRERLAFALAIRGSTLLHLGRPADALADLDRARPLAPPDRAREIEAIRELATFDLAFPDDPFARGRHREPTPAETPKADR